MSLWGIYTLKRSFTVTWKPPIFFSPKAGSFESHHFWAPGFDGYGLWWSISSIWFLWALHLGTNPLDWYLLVVWQYLSSAKSTAYWFPAQDYLSLTDVDRQRMASTTRVSYGTCVQCTHACLYWGTVYSINLYNYICHMSYVICLLVIYIYMIAIFLLCIPCRWFFHQAGRLWCLQSSRRNHRGRSHDATDVCLFFEIHPPSGSCDHRWHVNA